MQEKYDKKIKKSKEKSHKDKMYTESLNEMKSVEVFEDLLKTRLS
jgi:hypothetical protein